MKTHKFDGVSFFSGLFIAAIGLLYLIPNTPSDIIDAVTGLGGWFWPILFLAVGSGSADSGSVAKEANQRDRELGSSRTESAEQSPDSNKEHQQAKQQRKGAAINP